MGATDFQMASVPDAPDPAAALEALRRFHFGTTGVGGDPERIPGDRVPALLAPVLGTGRVSGDYPLFLYPADSDQGQVLGSGELLEQTMGRCAPGESDCRMLKDNLKRVERQILNLVADRGGYLAADVVFQEAARGVLRELDLDASNAEKLTAELDRLQDALPKGGVFVDIGEGTEWLLLLASCRRRLGAGQRAFRADVEKLYGQLNDRLGIEKGKRPDGRSSEAMGEAVGVAGNRFLDSTALAEIVGSHRGSVAMSEQRNQRMEASRDTIGAWLEKDAEPVLSVVHNDGVALFDGAAGDLSDVEFGTAGDPCAGASTRFDQHAEELAKVFSAVRLARLELSDAYDSAVHDAWFAAFDWQAFSPEEFRLMPCMVAFDGAGALAGEHMASLSKLLRGGRPIRVLVNTDPARMVGEDGDAVDSRVELGHFAVAHREACVLQGLAARPRHLLAGFEAILGSARPALMVVGQSPRCEGIDPWLMGGAAVEGRAHPLYCFDPEQGMSWDGWYSGAENPAPESDWPCQEVPVQGLADPLKLGFTFADFALLEESFAGHFAPVPGGLPAENLVPIAEYLALEGEPDTRLLPFVWAADGEGSLAQYVVSRRLLAICRDRLRYWQTIQELSGLRNHFAERAAAQVRAEERDAHAKAVSELENQHQARVEEVRQSAAGDAMQGLAQMLLDVNMGDLGSLAPASPSGAPAAAVATAATEESTSEPEAAAEEPEEEEGFDDPWVDTPLCTSCNDCVVINPRLFVYDDNKQVMIGDAQGGSFAELVKAAEACPAKCIHPGKPLDSSEANLPDLIQRAAAFS